MHQLLEARHKKAMGKEHVLPDCPDILIDIEANATYAGYEAHWPVELDAYGEPFEFLSAEEFFKVPLPGSRHEYIGEFDGVVRMTNSGRLKIFETKTERRNAKTNLPETWVVKPQVGLYLWAAEQVYKEPVDGIILDVVTRQSPAGKLPAMFRRDNLERSPAQIEAALRDLIWAADQIDRMQLIFGNVNWPQCREHCVNELTGWKCDYHLLHIFGETPETLSQYEKAEEYLAL